MRLERNSLKSTTSAAISELRSTWIHSFQKPNEKTDVQVASGLDGQPTALTALRKMWCRLRLRRSAQMKISFIGQPGGARRIEESQLLTAEGQTYFDQILSEYQVLPHTVNPTNDETNSRSCRRDRSKKAGRAHLGRTVRVRNRGSQTQRCR